MHFCAITDTDYWIISSSILFREVRRNHSQHLPCTSKQHCKHCNYKCSCCDDTLWLLRGKGAKALILLRLWDCSPTNAYTDQTNTVIPKLPHWFSNYLIDFPAGGCIFQNQGYVLAPKEVHRMSQKVGEVCRNVFSNITSVFSCYQGSSSRKGTNNSTFLYWHI